MESKETKLIIAGIITFALIVTGYIYMIYAVSAEEAQSYEEVCRDAFGEDFKFIKSKGWNTYVCGNGKEIKEI